MDFNIDLALKQSNENPIYYIEYANARICSILRKYHQRPKIKEYYLTLKSENTYIILSKLMEFEDIVISAAKKEAPHIIANYVYELATLFHSYYTKEQIITSDTTETEEKINLILSTQIVIQNALDLLGIIPREEM